jgi:hypothetical protein
MVGGPSIIAAASPASERKIRILISDLEAAAIKLDR